MSESKRTVTQAVEYVNPWHNPRNPIYGPALYATSSAPREYKGHLIYERISGVVWDVVKDGRAVTQRAGLNGAHRAIDATLGGAL